MRTAAHRAADGTSVDLGLVGDPVDVDPAPERCFSSWVRAGHREPRHRCALDTPGWDALNVNADVMACRVAAALGRAIW